MGKLLIAGLMVMGAHCVAFGSPSFLLTRGVNASFTVNYTGISNSNVKATAQFTVDNWQPVIPGGPTTTFDLLMVVTNTSVGPNPGGRVTGMGFSTTPDIQSDPNFKVVILDYVSGGGLTNEIFKQVDYSTGADLPQVPSGVVDFCVWAKASGGNCNGAGSGNYGILYGTTQTSKVSITYSGSSNFSFDKFYTRHQALYGGASDVATGDVPPPVPEPSFYGLLTVGLGGLAAVAWRRKQTA